MIRREPCTACPYRRDVASGVWAAEEYAKLLPYDQPTWGQPHQGFACHATPEHFCHGWAVAHSNRGGEYELLALRLAGERDVPEAAVPLFDDGAEAARHGLRDIAEPGEAAVVTITRLLRKHDRLRQLDPDDDECPAGGRHVWITDDNGETGRWYRSFVRCDHCGAPPPTPEISG